MLVHELFGQAQLGSQKVQFVTFAMVFELWEYVAKTSTKPSTLVALIGL